MRRPFPRPRTRIGPVAADRLGDLRDNRPGDAAWDRGWGARRFAGQLWRRLGPLPGPMRHCAGAEDHRRHRIRQQHADRRPEPAGRMKDEGGRMKWRGTAREAGRGRQGVVHRPAAGIFLVAAPLRQQQIIHPFLPGPLNLTLSVHAEDVAAPLIRVAEHQLLNARHLPDREPTLALVANQIVKFVETGQGSRHGGALILFCDLSLSAVSNGVPFPFSAADGAFHTFDQCPADPLDGVVDGRLGPAQAGGQSLYRHVQPISRFNEVAISRWKAVHTFAEQLLYFTQPFRFRHGVGSDHIHEPVAELEHVALLPVAKLQHLVARNSQRPGQKVRSRLKLVELLPKHSRGLPAAGRPRRRAKRRTSG